MYLVYALKEVGVDGLRYVGFTSSPVDRLGSHRRGDTSATRGWMTELRERGAEAEMVTIAMFFDRSEALDFEARSIRSFAASGACLLNVRTQPGHRSLRATRTETDGSAMLASRSAGSSQKCIADKIGVNQSTVSSWVRGLLRPETHHRLILSSLFAIPSDAWLTEEERAAVHRHQRLERLDSLGAP